MAGSCDVTSETCMHRLRTRWWVCRLVSRPDAIDLLARHPGPRGGRLQGGQGPPARGRASEANVRPTEEAVTRFRMALERLAGARSKRIRRI